MGMGKGKEGSNEGMGMMNWEEWVGRGCHAGDFIMVGVSCVCLCLFVSVLFWNIMYILH